MTGPNGGIARGVFFLIGAAPCALLVASPVAYQAAVTALYGNAVLVASEEAIDKVQSDDIMLFCRNQNTPRKWVNKYQFDTRVS